MLKGDLRYSFSVDEWQQNQDQINGLQAEIEQLQGERDEFQRRLAYIQDGHDPFAEIERLRAELRKYQSVGFNPLTRKTATEGDENELER